MPVRLGEVGSGGHCLWVELDYVGLEVLGMQGNKTEYESGKEELGFGLHGSSIRKLMLLVSGKDLWGSYRG